MGKERVDSRFKKKKKKKHVRRCSDTQAFHVWEACRFMAKGESIFTTSGRRGKVLIPGCLVHHATELDLPNSGLGNR